MGEGAPWVDVNSEGVARGGIERAKQVPWLGFLRVLACYKYQSGDG